MTNKAENDSAKPEHEESSETLVAKVERLLQLIQGLSHEELAKALVAVAPEIEGDPGIARWFLSLESQTSVYHLFSLMGFSPLSVFRTLKGLDGENLFSQEKFAQLLEKMISATNIQYVRFQEDSRTVLEEVTHDGAPTGQTVNFKFEDETTSEDVLGNPKLYVHLSRFPSEATREENEGELEQGDNTQKIDKLAEELSELVESKQEDPGLAREIAEKILSGDISVPSLYRLNLLLRYMSNVSAFAKSESRGNLISISVLGYSLPNNSVWSDEQFTEVSAPYLLALFKRSLESKRVFLADGRGHAIIEEAIAVDLNRGLRVRSLRQGRQNPEELWLPPRKNVEVLEDLTTEESSEATTGDSEESPAEVTPQTLITELEGLLLQLSKVAPGVLVELHKELAEEIAKTPNFSESIANLTRTLIVLSGEPLLKLLELTKSNPFTLSQLATVLLGGEQSWAGMIENHSSFTQELLGRLLVGSRIQINDGSEIVEIDSPITRISGLSNLGVWVHYIESDGTTEASAPIGPESTIEICK